MVKGYKLGFSVLTCCILEDDGLGTSENVQTWLRSFRKQTLTPTTR